MTNAERQRRYRERKREQQKAAAPDSTAPVTSPVTREAVTRDDLAGLDFGPRGARLWREIADEGGALKPAERVLLEEACRLVDRLDRLDRILLGTADDWLRFHAANEDGSIVKVVVNAALMEVRQQQTTLKALLAELRTSRGAAAKPAGRGRVSQTSSKGGAGVTDLAARIAARRSGAAG